MASRSRVMLVAGARPNFMKIAPIHAAMRATDTARRTVDHIDPGTTLVAFSLVRALRRWSSTVE